MDYESGRAIPNNQILGKIERVLGKEIDHERQQLGLLYRNNIKFVLMP